MAVSTGNVIFQISADLRNIQSNLKTLEGNFNTSFGRIEGAGQKFWEEYSRRPRIEREERRS